MNTNSGFGYLRSKLFRKFLVWFLLISLVPIVYLSYYSYNNARQIIEKEGLTKLISIAEQRVYEIDKFFVERERDITSQAKNPLIVDAMETMVELFNRGGLNLAEYIAEEKNISPFLTTFEKKFALHDILFISPKSDVVFTLKKDGQKC